MNHIYYTIIAVTVVSFAIVTVLFFVGTGFICYCHFNKKILGRPPNSRFRATPSSSSPPNVLHENMLQDITLYRDLEMKQNVAYGHITAISS